MPSVVQVVSATSAGLGAERARVGARAARRSARSGVRSAPSRGPSRSSRSSSRAAASAARARQRPVGARVQVGEALENGKLARATRAGSQTARIAAWPARDPTSSRCGSLRRRSSRARGDDALHALGGRASRPSVRRLRGAVALVGGRARGLLGCDLGVLRRARVTSPTSACSARARCPARAGSRARELNYAENLLRDRGPDDPDEVAVAARLRAARARRDHLGRAARAGGGASRRACARSASSAATGSSPTCRTSPRR